MSLLVVSDSLARTLLGLSKLGYTDICNSDRPTEYMTYSSLNVD